MRPALPAPNSARSRKMDAKVSRYRAGGAGVRPNFEHVGLTQFGVPVAGAVRDGSVRGGVSTIGPRVAVIQIARPIVQRVPISVADKWTVARNGECLRHKSVNPSLPNHPSLGNAHNQPPRGMVVEGKKFSSPRSRAAPGATDAPQARRFIQGSRRYRAPNFIAKCVFSHSEVTFRCGQGRALFPQRFRPAPYGRFMLCSQARTA